MIERDRERARDLKIDFKYSKHNPTINKSQHGYYPLINTDCIENVFKSNIGW